MTDTFRVLHLRASNFVGGPENQILRYAEFERAGPASVIVGTFIGPKEGREFIEAAKVRGLRTWALSWGESSPLGAVQELKRYLKQENISLLCTHGYRADVLGIVAARLSGVPVASFLRGWTREDRKVRFYEALNRFLLPFTSRLVCLSHTQSEKLARRRSLRNKTRIVTNAVEIPDMNEETRLKSREEICRRFHLPQSAALVAIAGRLSPEKGAVHFLQSLPTIQKAFASGRFIIFGEGPLRDGLERTAREVCPDGGIHFAGHVPDFRTLISGLDIVVNPSLSEEMPNVVLEAMAAGVPVVATNVGGVAEMAGADGLILVPPSDPGAIAKSVATLLADRVRAGEQGLAGQRRVREKFSPERQREQLRSLYCEMIPALKKEYEKMGDPIGAPAPVPVEVSGKSKPFVSVVIPARNEGAHVGSVIDGLLTQDYPKDRYEILVADGMSTDGTAAVVQRYAGLAEPRVQLFPNPRRLSSAGRNVGIRESRGDIICFIDGHCTIPYSTLISETVRLFQETGAQCLCRPQPLTQDGNTFMQNVIARARATALGHGRDSTIFAMDQEGHVDPTSSGAIYLKSVFDLVGIYDERFDACEDVEFNHRVKKAGLRAYSSPALAVYYRPRATLTGLFKQLVRYGRGRFRFNRKHHDAFTLTQMIPPAFVAGLLVGGVAALLSTPIRYAYLGVLGLYGLTVLVFSVRMGWRFGMGHFLAAPFVYATIHIALGVGFWEEAMAAALRFGKRESLMGTKGGGALLVEPPGPSNDGSSTGNNVGAKQTER